MLSILTSPLLISLITAGIGPLVGLATGKKAEDSKTITTVRAVQGFSVWAIALSILGSPDFLTAVLPQVIEFINAHWAETVTGSSVALVLSIVFEGLRRVTTGPVKE